MSGKVLTPEQREAIRHSTLSATVLAERYGVSRQTIYNHRPAPPRSDHSFLRHWLADRASIPDHVLVSVAAGIASEQRRRHDDRMQRDQAALAEAQARRFRRTVAWGEAIRERRRADAMILVTTPSPPAGGPR